MVDIRKKKAFIKSFSERSDTKQTLISTSLFKAKSNISYYNKYAGGSVKQSDL